MLKSLRLLGCLAIIAAPVIALPVHAETGSPPPPTKGDHEGWRTQHYQEHQEMQEMRTEREQLESERDSLKARCMDAKGQDRSSCETQMKGLREREAAMHQKMEGMHQEMHAQHEEHREEWRKEHHGEWKAKHNQTGKPAPSGTPTSGKSAPGKPSDSEQE
jgi:hypothetical protein